MGFSASSTGRGGTAWGGTGWDGTGWEADFAARRDGGAGGLACGTGEALRPAEAWGAIQKWVESGKGGFGIGVGSLVLTLNVILLSGYTLGCHSLRHLVGGVKDCMSESPTCHKMYKGCSALNKRHMLWAWVSLVGVMFSDVYVRLCSMGVWTDIRIL